MLTFKLLFQTRIILMRSKSMKNKNWKWALWLLEMFWSERASEGYIWTASVCHSVKKCFMLWMASLWKVIRKIETTFLCLKIFQWFYAPKYNETWTNRRKGEGGKQQLTVNDESPFILYCTIWYEWIFCATRQVFSIVIYHWNECQNAQWLIACLGKLWKWMKNDFKISTKMEKKKSFEIFLFYSCWN